jgi:phosphatidylglycerophosphatase A
LLFRIFDIIKPFPIGWLEKKFDGGLGVVIDDVAAGLVCRIILEVALAVVPAGL